MLLVFLGPVMFSGPSVLCQAQSTGDAPADPGVPGDEPTALLEVPDYTGDLWSRAHLSGDWGGLRSRLAERGFQLGLEWTQTVQSIEDGGRDEGGRYGGSPDLLLNLDLQRMGLLPGATLFVRAESRYGESINDRTGLLLPANTDAFGPATGRQDEDTFAVTNLLYTQYLSETFGLMLGKFDNLESDFNEFASGRGTTQFLNANFVFTPVTLLEPYSSIGALALWAPSERIFTWGGLYNTTEASTTSGLGDIGDGTSAFAEVYVQHSIDDIPPGGFSLGGIYNFDNDFVSLDDGFIALGPAGAVLVPATDETAWATYGSAWQYLWTEQPSDGVIVDPMNHEIDLQGVGVFLRGGTADRDVNPIKWTVSGGISGRGVFPSRDDDTFGVGYFYASIRDSRLIGALNVHDSTRGVEVYYRVAIAPSTRLTLDLQVLDSLLPGTDNASVIGLRLHMRF